MKLTGVQCVGPPTEMEVKQGQSVKTFTGALLPAGTDAVVMREYVDENDGLIRVKRAAKPGENIRRRGEELHEGEVALDAGTCVTPPVIGVLASFGQLSISVYRKPVVTCIITGDEIVNPGGVLEEGQIYDANSFMLRAALNDSKIHDVAVQQIGDERDLLRKGLQSALTNSDVVVAVGGASVGEDDLVREIALSIDIYEVFWKVAIKPGKPVMFGTYQKNPDSDLLDNTSVSKGLFFALPGNPVSALVAYRQFVEPALMKMTPKTA